MLKSTIATACALGCGAFSVQAEPVKFDTQIVYERELLGSAIGLIEIKKSIRAQARQACRVRGFSPQFISVDHECLDGLVRDATILLEAKEGVDFATLTPAAAQSAKIQRTEQSIEVSQLDF